MTRSYPTYRHDLTGTARSLRRNAPFPERLLWSRLRGRQLGVSFRRQRPVASFVVDFYCAAAQLVVELDGHSHEGRYEEDAARQAELEKQGLHVLRFTNDEVLTDVDSVVDRVRSWLAEHDASDTSSTSDPAP